MFGIGIPELILILAIALIVIGPKKLPDLAKSLGRALGEFKKATTDLKDTLNRETDITDVKKAFKDLNNDVRDTIQQGMEQAEPQSIAGPEETQEPPKESGKQESSRTETDLEQGVPNDAGR
jgi:TatA/E family protein of Tat protein translocase